jgi:glycosyltransferase involved in cell wall biosynthesis
MNVLVISEPGVDGVFRYVDTLCHFLWGQGIGVHLAYSDRRAGDQLTKLVHEVSARRGRTLNLRTANRPEPADGPAFAALLALTREVRPDVIHTHSSKAGFLGRMLRVCGVRAVQCYHPHAYVGMRPNGGRFDGIYNVIEGIMGRLAHSIVVSADEAAFARDRLRIPASRLHLIHNGVDLDVFSPAPAEERRVLREKLGVPQDALILGCMGRSSAQKDPVTLYRAFAHAAKVRPIALLHVGQGELDGVLDELVREAGLGAVIFRRPYTSTPADFYRAVDGFILTSRYEGFSLAALEAMAVNLPLILSDAPGNRDLFVQPLSHGWRAAPGDVEAFADRIVEWHDRARNGALLINHRQIAREHFDVHDRCGAVLRLYRQLMGSRRNSSADDTLSAEHRASA